MNNIQRTIFMLLLLLGTQISSFAQQSSQNNTIEVKGIVRDEMGPVIGASIIAKGQPGLGVTSDIEGKFKLKVTQFDVLVISFLGYEVVELPVVKIKDISNVDIKLTESTKKIDEVVVTASGTQTKKTLTGAYTSVDIKQLASPSGNLTNSLAGVVPGIIAVQSSGEPGENMSEFWIRGISTFGSGSGALVLVDGVERSMNEIPVQDIESFSILKDASATALYGSKGANGVVLITTKRGKPGKINIRARFTYGYNQTGRMPQFANAYDWATLANEAKIGRYESPLYTPEELNIIQNGLDPDLYPNINWQDLMLKKGSPQYKAEVSFSGGGDNVRYYVSGQYYDEDGIYKTQSSENKYNTNSTYKRYNYRANVDMNLTKTTLVKIGVGGWLVDRTQPGAEGDNIWGSFSEFTPLSSPRKYSTGQWPHVNGQLTPEIQLTQTGYRTIWENKAELNVTLQQELNFITRGLIFEGTYAFDTQNSNTTNRRKLPELWVAQNYRDQKGQLILRRTANPQTMTQTVSTEGWKRNYLRAHLKYNRLFADIHRVGAYAMIYQEQNADTRLANEGDIIASIPHRNLAYSGSFTYAFRDRYLVEFNWGYTGSENFEHGKQFGFFPSYSAGWIISEEPFIKRIAPWLEMLKIRGSYGLVGNDNIGGQRFPYISLIGTTSGYNWGEFGSHGVQGYRITTVGTPKLTWETAEKYNIGIDFNLFNSKITGTVDIYKDVRDDIFMKRNHMPLTTGLADQTPMANVGRMKATGWDGNIAFLQRIGQVDITLRANMTYQNNEVVDRDEAANELWYKMEKGFRLNQTRGLIGLGLFKDQEDIDCSPSQTGLATDGRPILPGDIKYKDVNGDGVITDDDYVPLGYREIPGLQYGMGASVQWKNLYVNVLFQGSGRRDWFVGGNGPHAFHNGMTGNILQEMVDGNRWSPREVSGTTDTENPNADWPRLTWGNNANNNRKSTFWMKNGRYLRLKNVEVTYDLSKAFARKVYMSNIRLGFVGENLYTWSPFKWWDPEGNNESGSNYPISRTFSFSVQVEF